MKSSTLRISHYRVEAELKRDSLGYFFRAIDEQLDRPVVLRVVRAGQVRQGAALAELRKRIRTDARSAAQLSHPNLVTIYEFRSLAETDIVVMELVDGETLEAARRAGQRWTVLDAARLLARLADALSVAHTAGLVHGNVSAANIRIPPDGRVKLLDLGVAKLEILEDGIAHEPADDVRGLARVATELLMPAAPEEMPEGRVRRDPLADPVAGRAQFGFLAPVLTKALRDPQGFDSAASFRDALLVAMDMATGRGGPGSDLDGGFGTHLVGPERHGNFEEQLPADLRSLAPMGHSSGRTGPRLVLPADLAERSPEIDRSHLVDVRPVPHDSGRGSRLLDRMAPGIAIAVLLIGAIGVAGWLVSRRQPAATGPGGAPVSIDQSANSLPPDGTGPPGDSTQMLAAATPPPAAADSATVEPPVTPVSSTNTPTFDAWVRAGPAGTRIRSLESGQTWSDTVQLSVPAGDSVVLEFSRPGYVTERRTFKGSRLAVELTADSAFARFEANVPAEVYRLTGGEPVRLGTGGFTVRLPTGRHRIQFRSPGQPDFDTVIAMPRPGQSYRLAKMDYLTTGTLIATVAGTWANIAVNGLLPRESPARFDSLSAGRHVVTVSRDGYETVVDTVLVQAGQVIRRQYTMRR